MLSIKKIISFKGKLTNEGLNIIINKLITKGNAEWEDNNKTKLWLYWKKPEVYNY